MKVHFTLKEMKNVIEKARADERERCVQAIEEFFGDNEYQNVWKDTLIEAIRKTEEPPKDKC